LSTTDRDTIRFPIRGACGRRSPALLDEAARLAARYGGTGWLIAETLAAGLTYGRALWFGTERNVGRLLARAADDLASPSTSSPNPARLFLSRLSVSWRADSHH